MRNPLRVSVIVVLALACNRVTEPCACSDPPVAIVIGLVHDVADVPLSGADVQGTFGASCIAPAPGGAMLFELQAGAGGAFEVSIPTEFADSTCVTLVAGHNTGGVLADASPTVTRWFTAGPPQDTILVTLRLSGP